MSETVIFVIGVIVFAVTVYGAVMAGGIALTRIEIEQNPDLDESVKNERRKKRLPLKSKY